MKDADLARRRARVARVNAKRPPDEPPIAVTVRVCESDDPEVLRRFARWLDNLLNGASTPDEGRG